ncbi:TAXI family TRAP transporter solute-binding subunit [Flintibacter muris]|uniref:TAXI family TRAP transporter solute-binding subunit n=1 Tax=Flintibacter muris TaxID=2941327 RepID=UPI00203B427A|nr:TAXI family TRAP transporter solute-binding subunit [Flintibacter muris]
MKKKIALALSLVMVMTLALTACGGGGGGGKLTFTTGSDTGTYYAFGTVLAGQISDKTKTNVTAIAGKGSKGNIEAMDVKDAQLGFVQSDVMAYAYNGERLFEKKIESFSTVAALYMEQVQIVTLDPSIKSVADLAGKSVSVGESGSGVYFNAVDVLAAYGLDVDKDIKPTYQSFGDSADALQDGKIDAAFVVAGAPTNAITALAASRDVYLVELDDEHIEKLIAESPYYSKNVISKDAYNLDADATTVAVGAVIIARDDCTEDDIYNVCSGIFDSIDTLGHDKKNELSLDFAASITAVPYHAGAAKYFSEKGFTVPTK